MDWITDFKYAGLIVGIVGSCVAGYVKIQEERDKLKVPTSPSQTGQLATSRALYVSIVSLWAAVLGFLVSFGGEVLTQRENSKKAQATADSTQQQVEALATILNQVKRNQGKFETFQIAAAFRCPLDEQESAAYVKRLFEIAGQIDQAEFLNLQQQRILEELSGHQGPDAGGYVVRTNGRFGPAGMNSPFTATILRNLMLRVELYRAPQLIIGPDGKLKEDIRYAFAADASGPLDYEAGIYRNPPQVLQYRYLDTDRHDWIISPDCQSIYDLVGAQIALMVRGIDYSNYDIHTTTGDRFYNVMDKVKVDSPAIIINNIRFELSKFKLVYNKKVHDLTALVYQFPADEQTLLSAQN